MKSLVNSAKAIAYLRVSTEEQSLGPEAQRRQIESWSIREKIAIIAWHSDQGVSGAAPADKRPGLARAINDLKAHRAGWLVVAKRDRLARDVAVIVAIERAVRGVGARLASTDGPGGDDPTAVFQRQILDSVAQLERGFIRARTKAALDVKRDRGECVGTVPYGFRVGSDRKTLEEDPKEQATIQRAREIRDRGITLRGVAHILDLEGHKSRRGTPFRHTQVTKMLGMVPRPIAKTVPPIDAETSDKPTDDEAAHRERVRAIFSRKT